MKVQRFVIALTILNFVLLLVALLRGHPTVAPVLRGKALEIVDESGARTSKYQRAASKSKDELS